MGICFGKSPAAGIAPLKADIRDALFNSGDGVFFADLTPDQILISLESLYDPSARTLLVDRMDNSNLTNTAACFAGAGHVTGSPGLRATRQPVGRSNHNKT